MQDKHWSCRFAFTALKMNLDEQTVKPIHVFRDDYPPKCFPLRVCGQDLQKNSSKFKYSVGRAIFTTNCEKESDRERENVGLPKIFYASTKTKMEHSLGFCQVIFHQTKYTQIHILIYFRMSEWWTLASVAVCGGMACFWWKKWNVIRSSEFVQTQKPSSGLRGSEGQYWSKPICDDMGEEGS